MVPNLETVHWVVAQVGFSKHDCGGTFGYTWRGVQQQLHMI